MMSSPSKIKNQVRSNGSYFFTETRNGKGLSFVSALDFSDGFIQRTFDWSSPKMI